MDGVYCVAYVRGEKPQRSVRYDVVGSKNPFVLWENPTALRTIAAVRELTSDHAPGAAALNLLMSDLGLERAIDLSTFSRNASIHAQHPLAASRRSWVEKSANRVSSLHVCIHL